MDSDALERQLRLGEDSRHEFKSVARSGYTIDAQDLARTVAALANGNGGRILLGVEDDGSVTGTGEPGQTDALMQKVVQCCNGIVQPGVWCSLVKVAFGDRTVLVVEVPAFSPNRPHLVNGRVYVRDANVTRPGDRGDLLRIADSASSHFDEHPVGGSRLDDLDMAAIERFPRAAFRASPDIWDPVPYLSALKCLDSDGTPTVTGILLFGREPQRWLPDARITAARIQGTEPAADFLDRQEFGGTLEAQIQGTKDFLDRHAMSASKVEGWERRRSAGAEAIPREALVEAIVNSVAHRDYRASAQIRVFVFDDRVEIVNPGELMNRLTIDSLRLGLTVRRNPVLADLLNRLGLGESAGVGVPQMIAQMQKRSLPDPEFDVRSGHFRVILRGAPAV